MRDIAAALPRTLFALPARIASRPTGISLSPHTRRRLVLAAVLALFLTGLYWFWLRDSGLVAVNEVEVSGLTTKDGPRIQATLETAAEDMTTLHVRTDQLEAVAREFPIIASIHVEPDFPHGLRIEVTERRPAGLVSVDGIPLPVASDGTVLNGLRPPEGLPVLRMEKPAADGRVTDPQTLRALLVAGAAPATVPQRIERVSEGPEQGIVVALEDGPEIIFGDADLAVDKWTAALRVLADADAAGATYIDVRLPERPVAGGLPVETIEPVAPAGDVVPVPVDPAAAETGTAPVDPTAAPVDPTAVTPETPIDPAATAPAPTPTTAAPPATGAPTAPTTTEPQP